MASDPVTGAPYRGVPEGTRKGMQVGPSEQGVEIDQEAVDLHVQRIPDSPPGDDGCASPSTPTRLRIIDTPSGAQPPVDRRKGGGRGGWWGAERSRAASSRCQRMLLSPEGWLVWNGINPHIAPDRNNLSASIRRHISLRSIRLPSGAAARGRFGIPTPRLVGQSADRIGMEPLGPPYRRRNRAERLYAAVCFASLPA